jgi:hypothetical protein
LEKALNFESNRIKESMSLSTHQIQKYVTLKIEKKWSKLKQNNNKNNNCSIRNFTEKFDLSLWNHPTTRQPPCGVGGPIRQAAETLKQTSAAIHS